MRLESKQERNELVAIVAVGKPARRKKVLWRQCEGTQGVVQGVSNNLTNFVALFLKLSAANNEVIYLHLIPSGWLIHMKVK